MVLRSDRAEVNYDSASTSTHDGRQSSKWGRVSALYSLAVSPLKVVSATG